MGDGTASACDFKDCGDPEARRAEFLDHVRLHRTMWIEGAEQAVQSSPVPVAPELMMGEKAVIPALPRPTAAAPVRLLPISPWSFGAAYVI
jgi:hypothetical protein